MIYDLQKASFFRRLSAGLFDGIILVILAVGFAFIISVVTGYDKYSKEYDSRLESYQQKYNVDFYSFSGDESKMSKEEMDHYMEAYNAFIDDEVAMKAYNMTVNLLILMLSLGIFLAFAIVEFVLPMIFKNGQTIGKKVFGLAVVRTNCVRINTPALFIRTLLGKYTIETMVPVLIVVMIVMNSIGIVGPIVILLILIIQIVMYAATPTKSLIHDMLSDTTVVDFTSQMIFDSEDQMIEYKKQIAAEKVANEKY